MKIKFDGDWIAAVAVADCFVVTSSRGDLGGKYGTRVDALCAGARKMWGVGAGEAPHFVAWHSKGDN